MSLTEARFHDLVDATQQALEDIFDDSGLDVDLENSAGVLTVKFEKRPATDLQSPGTPASAVAGGARPVAFTSITTKKAANGSATRVKSCWAEMLTRWSRPIYRRRAGFRRYVIRDSACAGTSAQAAVQQCQPGGAVALYQWLVSSGRAKSLPRLLSVTLKTSANGAPPTMPGAG